MTAGMMKARLQNCTFPGKIPPPLGGVRGEGEASKAANLSGNEKRVSQNLVNSL